MALYQLSVIMQGRFVTAHAETVGMRETTLAAAYSIYFLGTTFEGLGGKTT
jgi:hypothetical protein